MGTRCEKLHFTFPTLSNGQFHERFLGYGDLKVQNCVQISPTNTVKESQKIVLFWNIGPKTAQVQDIRINRETVG